MKRILSTLTLLLCFAFTAVNAQVITAERAAEIANSFFSAGMQKSAAARGVVASSSLTTSFDSNDVVDTASAEPTFYVLTNPEGGFVIVSGEETENPIIGYSFDGTINADELSDGFVDYMTDIDAQVKALRQYNANNPQKSAVARSAMTRATATETGGTIVVELNTAQWAQGSPYNNYCFLEGATGTTKASTGCVPTAYSILCYYHKWPESAKEVTVYHANTGASMTLGHTYDYESMANVSTEAGGNAVATLMRDLGWAYQVSYGVGNTGTGIKGEGPATLIEVFNYKSETPCNHGSYTTNRETLNNDDLWMQYIKESLDAGLPIPYSSTTSAAGTARHIYILDGYTNNNYFHFNWGWGGNGNGWFTLNNMVVDSSSDYSNSHKAYFKVMPNKTPRTVTATATPSNMGTVSINGGTAGSTATANLFEGVTATLTAYPAEGYALASWTKNGVVVGSKNTLQVTVGTDANDYVANFDDEANVTVIQDYTINATSGTELTTTKVQEWAFNANNDYPAALKLTSTTESINTNNAGDCIQLYLMSGTTAIYTLSVPEDYVITEYTIRCKTSNTYITSIAAEGQTYTPTNSYADYTFTKNTQARGAANSSELTIVGSANRALMVEAITVTVAKEGADVGGGSTPEPEPTPTTCTVTTTANPAAGGTAKFSVGTGSQKTQGDVENGTEITLYATANNGYNFVNWTLGGNMVSTDATCNVNVAQASNYVANFEANVPAEPATNLGGKYFRLKVNNTNNYMNIANTDNNTSTTSGVTVVAKNESSDTQIFLFEQSGNGYKLKANSGNYIKCHAWNANANTTSANDATVLTFETTGNELGYLIKWDNTNMNNGVERDDYFKAENGYVYCDAALNAASTWVLEEVVYYTVTAIAGNGGSVSPETSTVKQGNTVTLTATPNVGYHFVNWTKGETVVNTNATYAFTPAETATYKANFAINTYEINVLVNGNGGTASANVTTVNHGASVTLTATPNAGYHFVNWTKGGVEVGTTTECTINNITAAGEYVANFEINTYSVSVSANGTGGNAMIGTGNSTTVEHGASVTLTAQANDGYHFVNWTKGETVVSTNTSYTFNAADNGEYVANFEINTYTVSVSANGTGGNAMIGTETSATVNHGASVTLTATANDGYEFVNWTKGGVEVSTDASYTFNATADGEYIANFQAIQQGGETTDPLAGKWFRLKVKNTSTYMNIYDNDTHTEGPRGGVNVTTLNEDSNGQIFQFIKHNNAYYLQSRTNYYINCQAWNVDANSTESGAELTLEPTAEELEYLIKCTNGYFKIDDVKENPSLGKFVYCDAAFTAATTWVLEEVIEEEVSTYTISVSATEGGSAFIGTETNITVEHGTSVTLTAVANDGYKFVNWTKGGVEVSTDASYTFNATADGEYTANFQLINVTYYNVVVNANISGEGIAFIETGTSTDVTSGSYQAGSTITLNAVSDKGENGYLFIGWYVDGDDEPISTEKTHTFTLSSDVTYTAKFEEGWRVTYSCNYRMGYINVFNADGTENIGGTNYVLVKKGATIQMVGVPEKGYQFKDWTANATGDYVTDENPYYLTVDGNKTVYANFEPKSYVLTVAANDESYGTVSVESGEFSSDTSVKVGISMIATITAEANDGYEFVNWTKDGVEVSTEATYVIEAIEIEDVDAMEDVEYVAVFKKQVGTYYRIAYNFEVPVAAKSAATRAAGDTQTITLLETGELGGIKSNSKNSEWNSDYLSMHATGGNSGNPVYAIYKSGTSYFRLFGYTNDANSNTYNSVKYTLSAKDGYVITNCSFSYTQKIAGAVTITYNGASENSNDVSSHDWAITPNAQTVEITLSTTTNNSSNYLTVKNFTVTIQEVGSGEGETPEPETETIKYYVQSEACGVDGKDNALVMKSSEVLENCGASSIFYYTGTSLMSYSTGTFVNENGNTRGLQAIGATVGKAKIESNKIEFTNGTNVAYMHAKESNGIYYVDNCGATATCGNDDHNFIIEDVTSLPVTITDAGYATWYAPVAVELPDAVTAYTITINGDYAVTQGEGFKTVPANTGVILAGTPGTYDLAITTTTDEVESIMKGTVAATYIEDDAYVLGYINVDGEKVVGFGTAVKNQEGNTSWKNNSHKAYLPASALTPAQMSAGFRLMLPGVTAIEEVETENGNVDTIYDLTGRKLEGISGAGIYIVNGKKVLVK